MPGRRRATAHPDPAAEAREQGLRLVRAHPLFERLDTRTRWHTVPDRNRCPQADWAVVTSDGWIHLHPRRRGEPEEWAWVAAHCLLHLGFEHVAEHHLAGWQAATGIPPKAAFGAKWNTAACLEVNQFLTHLKVGRPPDGFSDDGPGCDLHWTGRPPAARFNRAPNWPDLLARGLARAVGAAVDVAGGAATSLTSARGHKTRWRLALDWFVANYPLLGALAGAFTLVEDAEICRKHGIRVAAISPVAAELYVNPLCGLEGGEYRFVIAHELLHAGLRHDTRGGGRDPWLWNVA
ncbi:MAG TPA: hypothetical protein VF482_07375, partial [Trebonia sp.]